MGHSNVTKVERTDSFDHQTGELLEQKTEIKSFLVEKEPEYVKLYTQDLGRLYGLKNSQNHVLMALANHMCFGTNLIVLYGPVKDVICRELQMNKNTFNMAIDQLYKQGFLIRKSRACYILDPNLFGTGSWANVKKVRLSVEYNPDGTKTIRTELDGPTGKETFGRALPMPEDKTEDKKVRQLPFPEDAQDDE